MLLNAITKTRFAFEILRENYQSSYSNCSCKLSQTCEREEQVCLFLNGCTVTKTWIGLAPLKWCSVTNQHSEQCNNWKGNQTVWRSSTQETAASKQRSVGVSLRQFHLLWDFSFFARDSLRWRYVSCVTSNCLQTDVCVWRKSKNTKSVSITVYVQFPLFATRRFRGDLEDSDG